MRSPFTERRLLLRPVELLSVLLFGVMRVVVESIGAAAGVDVTIGACVMPLEVPLPEVPLLVVLLVSLGMPLVVLLVVPVVELVVAALLVSTDGRSAIGAIGAIGAAWVIGAIVPDEPGRVSGTVLSALRVGSGADGDTVCAPVAVFEPSGAGPPVMPRVSGTVRAPLRVGSGAEGEVTRPGALPVAGGVMIAPGRVSGTVRSPLRVGSGAEGEVACAYATPIVPATATEAAMAVRSLDEIMFEFLGMMLKGL